ncbi:glycoside hydrolase family 10 [Catenulispora acidiphila DSM 44928]|uniref:Beta-xylanase n=1 Tax=Catenulispora acidiphila (strain DSM 44928 / JCM 14897 / NBRC 102108 / NRRL B-24433 / ID139908) TaxID=479433 RepID=C7Q386_CATAD|nr:endo-1,4-beta-xylanase [Catenulispora acidiphila]ACU73822.1 glycoside hydrolase family 10 [Catenulispora acidiphila DSM 44928]
MDIDTGAPHRANPPRPGRAGSPDRRGLRGALAVVTVAAITAAAGALLLGGQASAAPTTLRAGAEADSRYFGVAVGQQDLGNGTASNVAGSQFDMVTPQNEMKWDTVEPNNGQFNFSPGDAIVNFATSHNERVRGHNLVWHSQLPGWMSSLSGSQAKSAMEAHITGEVSHFKGKIYAWDVVNEPFNDDGSFRQDVFYNAFGGGAQYIGDAIRTAHAADPAAKLYINDYNIEGQGAKSDAMYNLAKTLVAQGVPLGGIGFESHFIVGQVPSSLQANMQRFAALGLDVAITELDDRMPTPASSGNLQQQATDDANIVKACLAIAQCPGITQWNISDADSWIPGTFPGYGAATLFDNNYQPKSAFNSVMTALSSGSVPPTSPTSGSSSPPSTYANLAASFDNVGISADGNTAAGNLDGGGSSFSQTALTNAHAGPGAQVTSSGVTFTMPAAAAGSNDNTVPQNQIITMSGTGTLGFLLTSSYGPATGTGTITYTDGSTQSYTLSSADWWATTPAGGSALAVSSTYQNRPGNTTATQSGNIFSQAVTLTAGKTLASVQLPAGSPVASGTPALHIFAISTTAGTSGGNTVTVTGPGNQSGTVGTAISAVQIQATDSGTAQTLTYTATGLPAGLSISSTGLITGTPTTAGSSTTTITATDATGAAGSATFTWTVTGGGTTTGVCHVTYAKTAEWAGGFTANVTIANTGTAAINGWTLAFTFPGDQKITNAWNGATSQSGEAVTATSAAYNASIAPGATTSFGFQGTFTSNDTAPTTFTVNGAACS